MRKTWYERECRLEWITCSRSSMEVESWMIDPITKFLMCRYQDAMRLVTNSLFRGPSHCCGKNEREQCESVLSPTGDFHNAYLHVSSSPISSISSWMLSSPLLMRWCSRILETHQCLKEQSGRGSQFQQYMIVFASFVGSWNWWITVFRLSEGSCMAPWSDG